MMRRVERLWNRALEMGVDDQLLKFLTKLRVIKNEPWVEYMSESHSRLIQVRADKQKRKQRASTQHYNQPVHAPRSIKPTKQRRF
jgi:hypothetical protein